MSLAGHELPIQNFLEQFSDSLCTTTADQLTPRYNAEILARAQPTLQRFKRPLLPAQANIAAALAHAFTFAPNAICAAEMSTGKSCMGGAVSALVKSTRTLILCPPHLVGKWKIELQTLMPGVTACILRSITDINDFAKIQPSGPWPLFGILSREKAKLGYAKRVAMVPKIRRKHDEDYVTYVCPQCHTPVRNEDGLPLTPRTLKADDRCRSCDSVLWTFDPDGPRRIALADFIGDQHPTLFDLLIADESQENKARASAQALAFALLLSKCRRGLALTGTLSSGKATSLFHLLWRMNPAIRSSFKISDEARWVDLFGTWETRTTDVDTQRVLMTGKESKRRVHVTVRERPGISPHLIPYLIGNTAFFQLRDLGMSLPPYHEHVGECLMSPELVANYQRLKDAAKNLIPKGRSRRDGHLVSSIIQALLAYPDRAWRGEEITDKDGVVRFQLDPLPEEILLPKEQDLVSRVLEQRNRGRRVLVYCTHTQTKDITKRLASILSKAGLRVAILPSSVKPEHRMEWIDKQTHQGLDALIANPKSVATGLDLVDFPTIIWMETEYSTYVVRQASRRSYRIPQKLPVEVYFLLYKGTVQEHAWALVAAGINSSLQTEGDVGAEGLNEYQQPDDMMTQLISQVLDSHSTILSAETMFAKLATTYQQQAPEPIEAPELPPTAELYDHVPEPIPIPTLPTPSPRKSKSTMDETQLTLFAA